MYLIPEDNLRAMKLITGQVEASTNGLEPQNVVIGTVKRPVIDIDHVTTRVNVSIVSSVKTKGVKYRSICFATRIAEDERELLPHMHHRQWEHWHWNRWKIKKKNGGSNLGRGLCR